MTQAENFQVWVDGQPTKDLNDSFEVIKKMAGNYIAEGNTVEIRVVNGPVQIWEYDNSIKDWVRK